MSRYLCLGARNISKFRSAPICNLQLLKLGKKLESRLRAPRSGPVNLFPCHASGNFVLVAEKEYLYIKTLKNF
jgi:hypothetical protein